MTTPISDLISPTVSDKAKRIPKAAQFPFMQNHSDGGRNVALRGLCLCLSVSICLSLSVSLSLSPSLSLSSRDCGPRHYLDGDNLA